MSEYGPASSRYPKRTSGLADFLYVALILAIFAFIPIWKVVSAHYESETYNRLTGAHTTWRDALWVELRVQDSPKR